MQRGQKRSEFQLPLFSGSDIYTKAGKKFRIRRRIHKGRLFLAVVIAAALIYFFLPRSSKVIHSNTNPENTSGISRENPRQLPSLSLVAESVEEFSFALYKLLSNQYEGKNVIFSPFSLSSALAMTYLGTKGESATQIEGTLKYHQIGSEHVHSAFHILNSDHFNKDDAYVLQTVNRLFGDYSYHFLSEFLSSSEAYYGAAFLGNTEEARKEINNWVELQTNNKIKDLIAKGAVNELTKLVIVNAVYFQGKWVHPFDVKATADGFFLLDGRKTSIKVPMMNCERKLNYYHDKSLKCQILELPYGRSNLSMLIILPDELDGLLSLEPMITSKILNNWYSNLNNTTVKVTLPRFKLQSSFSVKAALQKLGVMDLFDEKKADLSGMSTDKELYVSDALHKTFIEVTEEGTKAAAASAILINMRSAILSQPAIFNANHPFVFVIKDKDTGLILFIGRVNNPY
uniref:Leukocyte elastase inhibitor-like n=1 Tax=Saccoglossus kowalevskii TaxID=10224 RepID=A0ABM0GLC7_SACKO|nr:PREDICTED: leukocyte elastase inhibitor-like [Saccoglossus kowalevskii]